MKSGDDSGDSGDAAGARKNATGGGSGAAQRRKGSSGSSSRPISDKPFVTLVGRRACISCGPGALDGTLGAVPLDTDGSAAAKLSAPPRRPADKLRNIYTRGPRSGGFGRPWQDRCLGAPPKYHSDVYDGGRLKEKEMAAAAAKAPKRKPFVGASCPRPLLAPALPGSGSPPAAAATKAAAAGGGRSSGHKPWRSSGPPKTVRREGEGGREQERPFDCQRKLDAPKQPSKTPPPQRSWPTTTTNTQKQTKGAAFAVFSQVGRDFVPCPVPEAQFRRSDPAASKAFRPAGLKPPPTSMWAPNPYATAARPPPDIDFTLFSTGG